LKELTQTTKNSFTHLSSSSSTDYSFRTAVWMRAWASEMDSAVFIIQRALSLQKNARPVSSDSSNTGSTAGISHLRTSLDMTFPNIAFTGEAKRDQNRTRTEEAAKSERSEGKIPHSRMITAETPMTISAQAERLAAAAGASPAAGSSMNIARPIRK